MSSTAKSEFHNTQEQFCIKPIDLCSEATTTKDMQKIIDNEEIQSHLLHLSLPTMQVKIVLKWMNAM